MHVESNGGATALKEHDEQDNGREMDASAHQSGGIGGKKTLRVWQSYVWTINEPHLPKKKGLDFM